jgi:hypothetical protein
MYNEEKETKKKSITTGLVLAYIFKSPQIKFSSEFIKLDEIHGKNAYSVNINYIKYLIECIRRIFEHHASTNPILGENYKMDWQKSSNINTIKKVIDNDARLEGILDYNENCIIYTGKEIIPEKFVDKNDADLIWFAGKITLYADRIIEEKTYGNNDILREGHSK